MCVSVCVSLRDGEFWRQNSSFFSLVRARKKKIRDGTIDDDDDGIDDDNPAVVVDDIHDEENEDFFFPEERAILFFFFSGSYFPASYESFRVFNDRCCASAADEQ